MYKKNRNLTSCTSLMSTRFLQKDLIFSPFMPVHFVFCYFYYIVCMCALKFMLVRLREYMSKRKILMCTRNVRFYGRRRMTFGRETFSKFNRLAPDQTGKGNNDLHRTTIFLKKRQKKYSAQRISESTIPLDFTHCRVKRFQVTWYTKS